MKWPSHANMSVMNGVIIKAQSLCRETIVGLRNHFVSWYKILTDQQRDNRNLGRICNI